MSYLGACSLNKCLQLGTGMKTEGWTYLIWKSECICSPHIFIIALEMWPVFLHHIFALQMQISLEWRGTLYWTGTGQWKHILWSQVKARAFLRAALAVLTFTWTNTLYAVALSNARKNLSITQTMYTVCVSMLRTKHINWAAVLSVCVMSAMHAN